MLVLLSIVLLGSQVVDIENKVLVHAHRDDLNVVFVPLDVLECLQDELDEQGWGRWFAPFATAWPLVVQEYRSYAVFFDDFLQHSLVGVVDINIVSLLPLHEEETVRSHQTF